MTQHAVPSEAEALPLWDLRDLYAGPDDPGIRADLALAETVTMELAGLKGQYVAARGSAERLGLLLGQGIELYERVTNLLWKVGAYAALAASTARDDPKLAKLENDAQTRSAAIAAQSVFFTLELNQLEDWELEAAFKARPAAARWRPWLRRVRKMRPHELSPDLETLLLDRQPAVASWTRLFDETLARLRVAAGDETLTLSEALNRLSDPNSDRRRTAAEGLAQALERDTPVLALCLNTVAFEKRVEDRWRRFTHPAQSRHLANEVDGQAVDALAEAVVEHYPALSHRYYALKARALGKDALDYWDRNAPLLEAPPRAFAWDQAKAMTLDAFSTLGPAFADRAALIFERPWIDAAPRAGKSSGAYSHPVTAEAHPYVFMNYMGERRDVLTLAHEMGHAVHQTLAAPLGTLTADTPLTLAETASIFAEGLVFERLLAEAPREERRALLAGKIEDALNTVVRQIAFHRFETLFHTERAEGEVPAERIGQLWLQVQGESLGAGVRLNPGYEHYWAYVSHFVHAPFYVYAYAFGDLLVGALMERRRQDPTGFAPAYEALLAAGGSKTYVEALQPFGLDPREKRFWAQGCQRLARLIDEFESLG